MRVVEQYCREERAPLIDTLIKETIQGIHRGSIQGIEGSFYQQYDSNPVLSVNTITASTDRDTDKNDLPAEYRRARGIVMHDDLDGIHSDDHYEIFNREFNGHWIFTWRAVAKNDPLVRPPKKVDFDYFDRSEWAKTFVTNTAVEQARNASMLASMWWLDEVDLNPLASEMVFVSNVEGTRFGGQIDRLVHIYGGAKPEGIYATDYKLTHKIRESHYQQVEAFRRAFWPDLGPIDGLILRVDPIKREVESVSTHDEKWPDDAWDEFRKSAHDKYERDLMRVRLRQSVWH